MAQEKAFCCTGASANGMYEWQKLFTRWCSYDENVNCKTKTGIFVFFFLNGRFVKKIVFESGVAMW